MFVEFPDFAVKTSIMSVVIIVMTKCWIVDIVKADYISLAQKFHHALIY